MKPEMELRSGTRWKTQTKLHNPAEGVEGNCTQAVIASLLGFELDEVPDFNTIHAKDEHAGYYWNALEVWFWKQGWEFQMRSANAVCEGLYLASGKSVRGVEHFVVMENGVIVHDPHPSRVGIEKVSHIWVLMPLDPAAFTRKGL